MTEIYQTNFLRSMLDGEDIQAGRQAGRKAYSCVPRVIADFNLSRQDINSAVFRTFPYWKSGIRVCLP